ncbi:MAG: protein kinase [Chitinivibrionales bacterium]|nr:protein kinase [Chitinivibrionales bacterium]MBD3395792.1 protein kinase [Chitinivibrionales bacterium]
MVPGTCDPRISVEAPFRMQYQAKIDADRFVGRDLGTVTLLKKLGQGSNGVVFIGFQRTLKRQVAVKILLKGEGTTETSRQLFHQEAEMVAALTHSNIIPIFEMGEADDCYYQVMQLVKGDDLETMIEKKLKNPLPTKRTLPLDDGIRIIRQVLDALGYAHDEGVIHQDIKPANTLMEARSQRPLIADFGIARTVQAEIRQKGLIVGSPLYMAPERMQEQEATDARSDIYSVGVMFYKILVGVLPLVEFNPMGLLVRKSRDPDSVFTKRPSEVSSNIDPKLEAILLKAIHADAGKRYQTCREFDAALENYRAGM